MRPLWRFLILFSLQALVINCTPKSNSPSEFITTPSLASTDVTVKERELPTKSADAFKKHRDHSDFMIRNFFTYVPSPYAGHISEEVRCPSKFKPIFYNNENEGSIKSAVSLFAGERFDYGICDDARAKYFSLIMLIFCKGSQKSYEIKLYFKSGASAPDFQKLFDEFSCKKP